MNWQDGLILGRVMNEFTFRKLHEIVGMMWDKWIRQNRGHAVAVIGNDTRFQSDLCARICAEILASKGVKVHLAKEALPIGALLLALGRRNAYGIMVTGGESTVEFNGIRLLQANGQELTKSEWDDWEERLSAFPFLEDLDFEQAVNDGMVEFSPMLAEYIAFLREVVDCEQIKESKIRIIFDPLYGSAQGIFQRLLFHEGTGFEEIHGERHSLFGGLIPTIGTENLLHLGQTCQERHKHLGFAYDPEGRNWAYVHTQSGAFKRNEQIIPLLERRAAQKGFSHSFPHWRKDGILCSLLFLEILIGI